MPSELGRILEGTKRIAIRHADGSSWQLRHLRQAVDAGRRFPRAAGASSTVIRSPLVTAAGSGDVMVPGAGSGWGSRGDNGRRATPRGRAAAAIISRATISMFCMVQPAGSWNSSGEDVAAPAVDLLGGLGQPGGVAGDAHAPPHAGRGATRGCRRGRSGSWPSPADGAETGGTSSGRGPVAVELGDDVLGRARAVDQALEQAVRGEPVGAVQARAGDLAGRPEARQRRPAVRDRPSRRRSCNGRRGRPGSGRG